MGGSKGVWVFGIIFLIAGVSGLTSHIYLLMLDTNIYFVGTIVMDILFLILGGSVLLLKEWARRLIVYTIIPILIFYGFVVTSIIPSVVLKELGMHQQKLSGAGSIQLSGIIATSIWGLIPLYFFSCKKVKQQFKERGAELTHEK